MNNIWTPKQVAQAIKATPRFAAKHAYESTVLWFMLVIIPRYNKALVPRFIRRWDEVLGIPTIPQLATLVRVEIIGIDEVLIWWFYHYYPTTGLIATAFIALALISLILRYILYDSRDRYQDGKTD